MQGWVRVWFELGGVGVQGGRGLGSGWCDVASTCPNVASAPFTEVV